MNIKSTLITTLLIGGLSSGAMAGEHHDKHDKTTMDEFHKLEKKADSIISLQLYHANVGIVNADIHNLYDILDNPGDEGKRKEIMNDLLDVYKLKSGKEISCRDAFVDIYATKNRENLSSKSFLENCIESDEQSDKNSKR